MRRLTLRPAPERTELGLLLREAAEQRRRAGELIRGHVRSLEEIEALELYGVTVKEMNRDELYGLISMLAREYKGWS